MKKIYCPKCDSAWDKDQYIEFHMNPDTGLVITRVKIQDMVFCPNCFFIPRDPDIQGMERYDAKTDKVLLRESNVKIKSLVVEDEFWRYIDMSIDDFTKLKLSHFDPYPDDSSEGSAQDLRDDAPHAIPMPEGVRLKT